MKMICRNCGNQVPDGMKFCSRCGAEVERAAAPDNGGYAPSNNYNGGAHARPAASNGNKQLWLAVMAVMAMLGIMSVMCSSIAIKAGNEGVSIPFMSLTAMVGNASKLARGASGIMNMMGLPIDELTSAGGSITAALVGMIIYTVFAVGCIILYAISVVFTLKRKSLGIVSGMAASVLTLVLSIIMIIASFVIGSKMGGIGISAHPAVWTWLAIPIAVLYAAFCSVKSRELISR